MTVFIPHQTLISDAEIQRLRELVQAAELTLANGEPDFARQNLAALARQLANLAKGDAVGVETLRYGTVSVLDITPLDTEAPG